MTVSEQENTKEKLMGRTDMRKKLRVAAAVMAASMMFSAFSCASSSEGGGVMNSIIQFVSRSSAIFSP